MSDDRARHETVEVPLLDGSGRRVGIDRPDEPPPTNWRLVVGLASLAGVVGGLVISAVILSTDGDDDETPPTTTLSPDEVSALITTPPTLPRPGPPGELSEMDGLSSQDRVLFDPVPSISAPRYPNIDLSEEALAPYDLGRALGHLASDLPRRSTTRYEVGEDADRIDVTIDRDPARDRYDVTIDGDGDDARLIVDGLAGVTYFATAADPDAWTVVDNDELSGDVNLPTMIGRLQRGPVRDSTVTDAILVTPGPAVAIEDRTPLARRFAVTLRAGQVPEWARYQLGPVADTWMPDPDDPILFYAYVSIDDDGTAEIAEVSGTFPFGNTEQLVVHRIESLPDDFEIELPAVTAATVAPPATPVPAPSVSITSTSAP